MGKNDFLGNFEPQSGIWMGCKEEASCFASRGSIEEKDGEREKVLAWRGRISLPAESLKEGERAASKPCVTTKHSES